MAVLLRDLAVKPSSCGFRPNQEQKSFFSLQIFHDIWLRSCLCSMFSRSHSWNHESKAGFFFSASIIVVSLKVFAEVFWSITLMGSGHVWAWMWFWAKRCEWKGMKTDRVKHSRVKSWCSGRLRPDQCGQLNYPGVLFWLGLCKMYNCLHVSNLIYKEEAHTYCTFTHEIRQHEVIELLWQRFYLKL